MSPETIAHYRITGKLGEGGMGEVYRATDTKLGRDVAIKVIPSTFARDPDRMARFAREAQVLASLNHSNIAAIYGVEDGALILELVEGPTLAERIAEGPIPPAEALALARQIVEALEYAHEKGIIHRDLKPANIKVTADGKVKVLDFGLAKALGNDAAAADPASSPTLTMKATLAGVIMGTAAYMSPEQARGAAADRRADIWAFGVVLYEMLTGRQIFAGDTVSDTLAAVLKTDPEWTALPPETPPSILRLLRRCLARDRKRRLPDIADARLEIDDAGAPAALEPAAPARAGLRWWDAVLGLAALAGLAVAVVHLREMAPQTAPVRFQVPPPEKSSFANFGMALSPDGRRLALIATGPEGRPMLWVRAIDSLTIQPLPGTEGTSFLPFWSPDGRFIGFPVQGKLRKIEASGGPVQTLCEVPGQIIGGTWSRNGVIVFGTNAGGLYRVAQAGGVPTWATVSDASLGEIGHLRPWFLPDGQHFLYVTRTQKVEDQAIFAASLNSKERKRLVSAKQAGAYAPPAAGSDEGHLLFLRDTTLMAQPLDTTRLELTGEPFPVAERVGSTLAMGLFAVSANGVLAYRTGGAGESNQLVWFDREGKSLGNLGPPGPYNEVSLSPDGRRVAVDQMEAGNRDVWILDVARGVKTRFTFNAAQELSPVWSPDGKKLVFASDRIEANRNDIYQKDSSGSGDEELLLKGGRPLDWSLDGKNLLYGWNSSKTGLDLWVAPDPAVGPAESRKAPYLATPFLETAGKFSPDGRWVVYASDESSPGTYQIYVQSFPAGAGKFQISAAGGTQPRWRRDGKEIFFIAPDGKLMAVDVKASPQFEADAPRELFDSRILAAGGQTQAVRYDVTADGKRFLVNTQFNASDKWGTPITVVLNWQAAVKR